MARHAFEAHYRDALQDLGFSLGPDDALDDDLPASVPSALRAWYQVAGRSWLNAAHNRILGPNEIVHESGKTVFAKENQEAVIWGFDASETADDPEVWQGLRADAGHELEWHSEEATLSRFLVDMIRHTVSDDPSVE